MPRELTGDSISSESDYVLPIASGGTGSASYKESSNSLQYPLIDNVGFPLGLAPLDANGLIPGNMFPSIILSRTGVQVSGPLSVGIGLTATYQISNYLPTTTYTVSAIAGSASVSGSTITYTAPLTTGLSGFIINGTSVSVNVVDPGLNPIVSGPSSLLENSQGTYTITNYDPNSTYNITALQGTVQVSGANITYTAPAGDGIHLLSGGFSVNGVNTVVSILPPATPVITGPSSIPYLTSTTLTITNYQSPGTYNVSISNGQGTVSISGNTITYTSNTAATGTVTIAVNAATYTLNLVTPTISQPSILSPVNGASNLGPTVSYTSSAFSAPGTTAEHQAQSNWQLATDPAFNNVVQSSYNDTVNLTSWTTNNLAANTTYYIRVQYIDQFGNSSPYSAGVGFSTKVAYIASAITARISSGVASSNFGNSVSINSTGTIAIIGAPNEGAAYIYTIQNGIWTQTARLYDIYESYFGWSVSINSTGTTAIIAANSLNSNGDTDSVYIYTNQNGTWTQTARITGGTGGYFGYSVSINSDGTVAIIGNSIGGNIPAVYIYTNQNGTWTRTASLSVKFTSFFSTAVSINSDGTVAIIQTNIATYVFTNQNGTWTQTAEIAVVGGYGDSSNSVSINSDGTIAIIGADGENYGTGAAYIYTNQNGTWSQTARIATAVAYSNFGTSVSINSNGTIAIIGASNENAAYVYANQSGTWTQISRISNNLNVSYFGNSVSINSDGTIAIIGSTNENSDTGAAYIAQ